MCGGLEWSRTTVPRFSDACPAVERLSHEEKNRSDRGHVGRFRRAEDWHHQHGEDGVAEGNRTPVPGATILCPLPLDDGHHVWRSPVDLIHSLKGFPFRSVTMLRGFVLMSSLAHFASPAWRM